ncbi:hypothetical protein EDD21DRAFT_413923 [Dissophora ornata]|nr:hypothetical protein EDD21DRAFT_413923 [Dissophora ornata]
MSAREKQKEHSIRSARTTNNLAALTKETSKYCAGGKGSPTSIYRRAKNNTVIPPQAVQMIVNHLQNLGWIGSSLCNCAFESDVCIASRYRTTDYVISGDSDLLIYDSVHQLAMPIYGAWKAFNLFRKADILRVLNITCYQFVLLGIITNNDYKTHVHDVFVGKAETAAMPSSTSPLALPNTEISGILVQLKTRKLRRHRARTAAYQLAQQSPQVQQSPQAQQGSPRLFTKCKSPYDEDYTAPACITSAESLKLGKNLKPKKLIYPQKKDKRKASTRIRTSGYAQESQPSISEPPTSEAPSPAMATHESSSSASLPPVYRGEQKMLPDMAVPVGDYFQQTEIGKWNLCQYLVSTDHSADVFLGDLGKIHRAKRLPASIVSFAYSTILFYDGTFGQDKVELAHLEARKQLGKKKNGTMSYLLSQKDAASDLDQDLSAGTDVDNELARTPAGAEVLDLFELVAGEEIEVNKNQFVLSGSLSAKAASSSWITTTNATTKTATTAGTSTTPSTTARAGKRVSTSTPKKKKAKHYTEQPWHDLMICLVNNKTPDEFPEPGNDLGHRRRLLFDHAVDSLEGYLAQGEHKKDIVLLKDAFVCASLWKSEAELIADAKDRTRIQGFGAHACTQHLKKYHNLLLKHDIKELYKKLIIDRATLVQANMNADQQQMWRTKPSKFSWFCKCLAAKRYCENDCLQLWVRIFVILATKITIHTGEQALKASRIVRFHQQAEYGDVSDAGRKVDCLLAYKGLELSNAEFKHPAVTEEVGLQTRKSIQLARAFQEAHHRRGAADEFILMMDISLAQKKNKNLYEQIYITGLVRGTGLGKRAYIPTATIFFGEKYKEVLTAMKRHVLVPDDELIGEGLAAAYNKALRRMDGTGQA